MVDLGFYNETYLLMFQNINYPILQKSNLSAKFKSKDSPSGRTEVAMKLYADQGCNYVYPFEELEMDLQFQQFGISVLVHCHICISDQSAIDFRVS